MTEKEQKNKKFAEQIKEIWDKDQGAKGTLLNTCQECAEFFLPRRSTINVRKELGSKRSQRVFRSSGQRAASIWATGMMNGIFPVNSVFHANKLRGIQIEDTPNDGRKWLEDVAAIQYEIIRHSNFDVTFHSGFLDEGVLGTSCIFVGESKNRDEWIYCKPFSIENYTLVEDYQGRVEGVVVVETYTTSQLVDRFGDAVPEYIKRDNGRDQKNNPHKVLFGVLPNKAYDPEKTLRRGRATAENRPFKYVHALEEGVIVLETGGYYEMPFIITRINKNYDEKFGRSPAMDALAECKMLNKIGEYDIAATERLIIPPYIVDSTSIMGPINPQPGAITPADLTKGAVVQPWPTAEQPAWGERQEALMTQSINAIFMTDVFVTIGIEEIAQPNITATQLTLAKNERLALLGPNLRINEREKIRPFMDRIFGIAFRNGLIPPPPESIRGLEFVSEPNSPLFSAVQNAFEVEALNRQIGYCAQLSQVDPAVWDHINIDEGFNLIASAGGTSARTTRSREEIEQIRKQRAEEMQAQQTLELALQAQTVQPTQG